MTTSHEYSLQIAEKEQELAESLKSQSLYDQEILDLDRKILELRTKKKELEMTQSKGMHNLRQLKLTIKDLERKFWGARDSGT